MIAIIIFRPLIIIALLVISIVFVLQNQQPVALVIFGTKTIQLSLAVWVLIFAGAGLFTSLLLQLLYVSFRRRTPREPLASMSPPEPVAPPPRQGFTREVFESNRQKEVSDRPSTTDSQTNFEWDRDNSSKDWDIETPPSEPTVIQKEFNSIFSQEQASNFEVQQQPKTTSRQGSVYSYSYREAKPPERRSPDPVYDADYRVINSPYPENPPQSTDKEDEDEEWV
ncbi:lipopolysaccharide assembly protein LapA domain-containing protein [Gloeothece verrucosa]|uniref:Lipopolysaccharide assembly protein A domain-containing protein n=1 Tax=Gloeothece verrucosa (strain PCC 7822) TaxID=497965 RepID=E0U961_GLOV7|nr:lipopolysaccharide assembly protein LapA domain-containing protein [Gloeothece verrucosa]ADN17319.1 conserved hypothetical protein [Gloeothece verrucosa PCC 7822]